MATTTVVPLLPFEAITSSITERLGRSSETAPAELVEFLGPEWTVNMRSAYGSSRFYGNDIIGSAIEIQKNRDSEKSFGELWGAILPHISKMHIDGNGFTSWHSYAKLELCLPSGSKYTVIIGPQQLVELVAIDESGKVQLPGNHDDNVHVSYTLQVESALRDLCATSKKSYYDRSGVVGQFPCHFPKIDAKALFDATLASIPEERRPIFPFADNASGIKKLMAKMLPHIDAMRTSDPLTYYAFAEIVRLSKRTINDVSASKVINEHFANRADSPEQIAAAVREWFLPGAVVGAGDGERPCATWDEAIRKSSAEIAMSFLPAYRAARKIAVKAKGGRAISLLSREMESLSVSQEKHPLTYAAIQDGRIPIGTFFRKTEQYFPYNQNWDLWEEMLAKYPGEAEALAADVTSRSTYEKDLMSYFWFVLRELPEYLERHTGKQWRVKPKIVHNVNDDEPPDNNGIRRTRSALTPQVNNDKNEVEVPYASIVISGRQTTYTYGHDFSLLKRGFTFKGNVCTRELEEKLNGRDDYGLMFYTLTGSPTGRGYPTFLIIFERRDKTGETHVHFHRVHPSRSKSGEYNPVDHWTRTSWNWMHGNISTDDIVAQQGDFVVVRTKKEVDPRQCQLLQAYDDSHKFSRPVPVMLDTGKSDKYRIGWVVLDKPVSVRHHEHNNIKIPKGTYELRQLRSWEANPVAIWTASID